MSGRDVKKYIREQVRDLIWQTAHLYKDAPGGKLACSQRSRLARYVDSKMMTFDFLLEKARDEAEIPSVVEDFLSGLEQDFQAVVHQEEAYLALYQEKKRDCLKAIWGELGDSAAVRGT